MRRIDKMTGPEIAALDKEEGVLVLPIGALEQHGPHMTIDTDLCISEKVFERVLAALPDNVKLWYLPTLPISNSYEHHNFAGSFWLKAETMMHVLLDIAEGVANSGFRRLLLWNCHGGNIPLLNLMAREIRIKYNLMTFNCFPPAGCHAVDFHSEQEKEYGIHGGEFEASVMLALSPERVRQNKLLVEYPDLHLDALSLEGGFSNIGWETADLSHSGMLGDATKASAERGEERLKTWIPDLVKLLIEVSRFEFPVRQ